MTSLFIRLLAKYGELSNSSILVLVSSLIFALLIGLIDFAFDNLVSWFYKVLTMTDLKWYVVRSVSGQERKVKSYLDNEIAVMEWRQHNTGSYSLRKSL